jgi:hypothetical protein
MYNDVTLDQKSTMPQELKDKWVAALRSGEYKQGKHCLHGILNNTFCCLGVLEHVADGECETSDTGLPTQKWCEDHNVNFNGHLVKEGKPAGFYPVLDICNCGATPAYKANDTLEMNFNEIADLIESQVEGV